MLIEGIKTRIFEKNESLEKFIHEHIPSFEERTILVITSKIVALAEGRTDDMRTKKQCIRNESERIIETPWAPIALSKKNEWLINAGIDESNAKRNIILLPKDSFKTAESLCKKIKRQQKLKDFGVIISDTRSVPLRVGTIGRSIGHAGFKALRNYIGKKDLFGRETRTTQSNHADALAAAAVCVMGEGNERTPMAKITQPPVSFTGKPLSEKEKELSILPKKDIFSYLFTSESSASHTASTKNQPD